jgi:predicted nuclease with TOPRIM domain
VESSKKYKARCKNLRVELSSMKELVDEKETIIKDLQERLDNLQATSNVPPEPLAAEPKERVAKDVCYILYLVYN